MGRSCPKFRGLRSFLVTSVNGTGWLSKALSPDTLTSSKEIGEAVSESFACSFCANKEEIPAAQTQIKTVVFIRKYFTNKRGNYSG